MTRSAILINPLHTKLATDRGNPLSIAPMMDRTDRHFRYFMRQITRRTLLYTEMITTGAVIHGDRAKLLGFSPEEKPISLQLGGDNPAELAECARIAEGMGYDEVNLNLGCPSDRVKSGNFGACLMLQPDRVAQAIEAMRRAVKIPVTVKHRIGVDDRDRYEDMAAFVRTVAGAGCERFTVHARKAWLQGLSPKENRTVPPLRYEDVYQLKREFPDLFIEINGGIQSLDAANDHLQHVDAVMIGRAAYDNPYLLADADRLIHGDDREPKSRAEVVENMIGYCDRWMAQGFKLGSMTRHMLQLFAGQPGTKAWKRYLSERVYLPGVDATVLHEALAQVHAGSL
jgi:tRNA-dihydrouridine synthase A